MDIDIRGTSSKNAIENVKNAIKNFNESIDYDGIRIFSESPVTASEIKRVLEANNFVVELADDDGRISVHGIRKSIKNNAVSEPEILPEKLPEQDEAIKKKIPEKLKVSSAYLFSNQNFSRNKNYGKIFLNKTLKTIANLKTPPDVIALVNDSVKLALYNTSTCDLLKILERKGTRVLVSGMCSDNFGVTEIIGAGIISEIDEILEEVSACDKVISL